LNCFISTNTDIYYNLALEEFLLKKSSEDFFFLWRSTPVAVIGKHQNPYKELDYLFTLDNNIQVARRLSGGGTVYQDLGNINFTIIKNTPEGKQINLKEHSKPIFEALKQMGVNVQYSNRNDFLIEGKKFSGNAEHIYKNRVLHHGTLLFDTDLDILESVIRNKADKYKDRTIASVKSKVANLKDYLVQPYSAFSFQEELFKIIVKQDNENVIIPEPLNSSIFLLREDKYSSNEWIFSYTPKYKLVNNFKFQSELCSISLEVKKGEIKYLMVSGLEDRFDDLELKKLIGKKHLYDDLKDAFSLLLPGNIKFLRYFF